MNSSAKMALFQKITPRKNDDNNESNPFSERIAPSLKIESG